MKLRKRLSKIAAEIEFVPLKLCSIEEIEEIRTIRNDPLVRDNMYSNHEISVEEHASWVHKTANDENSKFLAVHFKHQLVGGIGVSGIDRSSKRADWAFYLKPSLHGHILGPALELKFLDWVFAELPLEKLHCEVLEFNKSVISLHKKFGFREEGKKSGRVVRDGTPITAVLLAITKTEWLKPTSK